MKKSKAQFLDSLLESTITNKKVSSNTSKLNSYEQQQKDEEQAWSQIAKANVMDDEEGEQPADDSEQEEAPKKKPEAKKELAEKKEDGDDEISREAQAVE